MTPKGAASRLAGVVLAALVAATACSGDDGGSPGPELLASPPPDGAEVTLTEDGCEPAEVAVDQGEAVVFRHEGDEPASVVSDDLTFDSGALLPGEVFRFLTGRAEPGRLPYRCGPAADGAPAVLVVRPSPG